MNEFRKIKEDPEFRNLQDNLVPKNAKKDKLFVILSDIKKLLSREKNVKAPVVNIPAPKVTVNIPDTIKIDEKQLKKLSKKTTVVAGGGGSNGFVRNDQGNAVNPATEEKQDDIIDNQTNGTQTTSILDSDGNVISAQYPFSTDGDSVYEKDVDVTLSDVGTFTGDIANLFNSYEGTIDLTDTSATNPKWYKVKTNRPITADKITIGTNGHTFSNVKITLMSGGGEIVSTIDDSANGTGYINNTYNFSPIKFNVIKVEFYTANSMYIAGMSINKAVEVVSRMQALKPDGTLTDIDATAGGNLKVSIEEMEVDAQSPFFLRVAKGDVAGHSIVNKFGQNSLLNSTSYEDVWDGGGTYTYPADGSADITKVVSASASDVTDVEVQGLSSDGTLTVQTVTLTGTTPVVLPTPLWRVFRMKNVGAVDYVGNVSAQNTAQSVVYAIIQAASSPNPANNQTLMALYTIPLGKKGYLLQGTNMLIGTNRTYTVDGRLTMRPYGGVFQLKKTFGLSADGTSYIDVTSPLPGAMPALTDIRVSAISSATGGINTTFAILLIDQ